MKKSWAYKKLGEVCTIERGGSPRPINEFITDDPNGLNWIKIGDAKEGSKYITSTKEKIKPEGLKKTRLVHKGDFILSNSMSYGKPYILDIDGCIHDGWLVIHDDNDTFDKSYLYYLLESPNMYMEFQRLAVGGVVNNLNSEIVRNVVVAIPPRSEQAFIVSELDLLQSIIDKQKAQLKELDNLAQAIFYDMFGDPVENEKGWEVKTLKEVGQGKLAYGSGASAVEYNGEIRYIRITDIEDDGTLKEEKVSPSDYNSKYLLNEGDILFARSGATVGKTYLHKPVNGKCIYAGYLIRLIPNTNFVLPEYVFGFTKTAYYKSFIAVAQKAVAQPNINAEQYGNLLIGIPPLPLQQSFAAKIESIEKQKASITKSIEETQKLFDYTMDKYFG